MISVGSRDGMKDTRLGSGSEKQMDETELEEGEACSYQDDDTSIDPDVALSYLDEKVQDVLGHFKKDFEGGVSAENLGAKFGGYGSFLPVYQRSPVWSHLRSPSKVQNNSTSRSLNNLQVEGDLHDCSTRADMPHSVKHVSSSVGSASSHAYKVASQNGPVKQNAKTHCVYSADESTPKSEVADRSKLYDQRTLKVIIKVGSDNFSTKKNAVISDLGLDVSPTSSFDDSPTESEGISHGPPGNESPSQILQMMFVLPMYGGCLLSPLPDYLAELDKKAKLPCDTKPPFKVSQESSFIGDQCNSIKNGRFFSGEQKVKSAGKSGLCTEWKEGSAEDGHDHCDFVLKKEAEVDNLACEELVSNALKLPLLSSPYGTAEDSIKGSPGSSLLSNSRKKGIFQEKIFLDREKEAMEEIFPHGVYCDEKPNEKELSAQKDAHEIKTDFQSDMPNFPRKGADKKAETGNEIGLNGNRASIIQPRDPRQLTANLKSASHIQEGKQVPLAKEPPSSGSKKKPKRNKILGSEATGLLQGSIKTSVSVSNDNACKNELKNLSMQNGFQKAKDKYKDFFGDMNELEDDAMESPNVPSEDRLKTSQGTYAYEKVSGERSNSNGAHILLPLEGRPKGVSNVSSVCENLGPVSDPVHTGIDMDDNWVCCDKCQKWRLLPLGTKLESLPERWICSMMTWMSGMNRCSTSEEETTKALTTRYQLPPQSQNSLCGPLNGALPVVSPSNVLSSKYNHTDLLPYGGRKKHALKEVSNPSQQDGSIRFPGSKKKLQQSVKSRSLTDASKSPLVNNFDFQCTGDSIDASMDNNRSKKKDKQRSLDCYSDGGHIKHSKSKRDKKPDQDSTRSSKKIKTKDAHHLEEDWTSAHDRGSDVLHSASNFDLPSNAAWNCQLTNREQCSSQNSKCDINDNLADSVKRAKLQVGVPVDVVSLNASKPEDSYTMLKRKVNNSQDAPSHAGLSGKVISDAEQVRVKKAKISKSEGKESSTSKGNGRADKRSRSKVGHQRGKDLDNLPSSQHFDDSAASEPAVAATSSSSKVSGSCKTKSNFQEVKGSPVESVTSSPFRNSSSERFISVAKNPMERGNGQDVGSLAKVSSKGCLDSKEDGGSDRAGTTRRYMAKPVNDQEDRSNSYSLNKIKPNTATFFKPPSGHTDALVQRSQCFSEAKASDRCLDVVGSSSHLISMASHSRKSVKGSSSRSKDRNQKFKSEVDKGKLKISESYNNPQDLDPSYDEHTRDTKIKGQEKSGLNTDRLVKDSVAKKDSSGNIAAEGSGKHDKSNSVSCDASDPNGFSSHNARSTAKQSGQHDYGEKRKKIDLEQADQMGSTSGREKSHHVPLPAGNRSEMLNHCPRPCQVNDVDMSALDPHENAVTAKETMPVKKAEKPNGAPFMSKHPVSSGHRVSDGEAASPMRRDSSSQAASNLVKEAKDLKHLADRRKNSGATAESTGLYFQAALKFLHGASLLELNNGENSKSGDLMTQSRQIYSSTAKLCEFCAHEYEKSKEMAAAALAYKCMEVAYLKVIYSSHSTASRDRHELQTALQMVPLGESPSSSASDIDNSNNPATGDKVVQARDGSSPQIAGSHIVAARNRPNFLRLLNFAHDVNFAMEASRKSRLAFVAANTSTEQARLKEGISAIKRALDFNFHDVKGLLRLVRLAMEAISR
ncbi:hypothetical protein Ancab_021891 [Ancistrocladus abbreviatus]